MSETMAAPDAAPQQSASAGSRRPRWLKPVVWVVGIVLALVVLFFIADAILRSYAEGQVAKQIKSELPTGITANDLSVDIGGFSVIGQYLGGSFQQVTLTADKVKVNGVPAEAKVVAEGIPTDFSKPVDHVHGAFVIDQEAANRLISIPNSTSTITFGAGTLGYSGKSELFGLPIQFHATVVPKANGKTVELTPKSVKVTGASTGLDLSGIVSNLLGNKPIPLCVAQYLPKGVSVTDVTVKKGEASAAVSASDIVLDGNTFSTHGSCSAS